MKDNIFTSLISEFLSAFFVVLIGGSAVALTTANGNSVVGSALAFGLVTMMIIYVFGKYSGAHANPAVSFGFAIAGQMNWGLMIGYWIAQILGAIAAAALVSYIFGNSQGGASTGTLTNTDSWKAFIIEAFVGMFIVAAYLFMYRNPEYASISAIGIGLVLTFCFLAFGPLTGASGNPARSFGPAIFTNNLNSSWIYWIAPLVGALVAGLVYWMFTWDYNSRPKMTEGDCPEKVKTECGDCIRQRKVPVVDNCGKPVLDDCKKPMYEWIDYIPEKRDHKQTTWLKEGGKWLKSHGASPLYIKEQVNSMLNKSPSTTPALSVIAQRLSKVQ
jgi:MIP family channel proteins